MLLKRNFAFLFSAGKLNFEVKKMESVVEDKMQPREQESGRSLKSSDEFFSRPRATKPQNSDSFQMELSGEHWK